MVKIQTNLLIVLVLLLFLSILIPILDLNLFCCLLLDKIFFLMTYRLF